MESGQRAESVLISRIFSFSLAIATDQERIKYFNISGHRLKHKFQTTGALSRRPVEFYLWIKLYENNTLVNKGAAKVAAIEKIRFKVTTFADKKEIERKGCEALGFFPILLCMKIMDEKMNHKTQTLLFFSVSVMVFLVYVKIDRQKDSNDAAIPFVSEEAPLEPLKKGIWPDRLIDTTQTRGGAIDRIKDKLKSVLLGKMVERAETTTTSFLQLLMKIAEGAPVDTRTDYLFDHAAGKNISEYMKCFSNGSSGEIPGDRVEINYPVSRYETVTLSIEGGDMYYYGHYLEKNDAEAIKWYRKSAARNNAYAQYNLGNFYTGGYPLRYDFNEAFKWYRKAAENGHASAQKRLGVMYQMGQGTKPNHTEAASGRNQPAVNRTSRQ